jgi:hypothetical protein
MIFSYSCSASPTSSCFVGCYAHIHICTVTERVAGSDCRKGSFLTKHLIGKKSVLNENKWKLVVFQNIFSLLISKSKSFLIYLHSLVWTWTHLVGIEIRFFKSMLLDILDFATVKKN